MSVVIGDELMVAGGWACPVNGRLTFKLISPPWVFAGHGAA
ncbi:MAG: hypothetical protein ABTR20_04770 [Candidatus Competibacter sp.]|nr:hypothetical protein [Candidatus Competibacter sp.]